MPNSFPNVCGPKSQNWNPTAEAGFRGGVDEVSLRENLGNDSDFILAPFGTGALKRPELVGRNFRVREGSIETVTLRRYLVEPERLRAEVFITRRSQDEPRELIIDLQHQGLLNGCSSVPWSACL